MILRRFLRRTRIYKEVLAMEQRNEPMNPPAAERKKRILSGIQPSGTPTLGNYIGAMRNWKLL